MLRKGIFKKPRNALETYDKFAKTAQPAVPEEMCLPCPSCRRRSL
jgi:acetyl-CoA carboxylase carboxyl transferase subunit beta